MRIARGIAATAVAVGAVAGLSASAQAAFPNFSDCPRSNPAVVSCLHVQSRAGSLTIKGFTVPIGESFQIRGGVESSATGELQLVAPTGTTGVFSKPIQVPGGLLGIDFPIPGNAVTATAELAGVPSQIKLDLNSLGVRIPLKMRLSNPLIGPNCHIGSNSSPVNLNLITGTTSPPAPNRPISGRIGTFSEPQFGQIQLTGNRNVDNSFSIPGASSCGLGLGLIDQLVNAKLKLPSSGGNNTMIVDNDLAQGVTF